MACKEETTTIGTKECFCVQWPATKALTMKFRIVKVLGASVAELASGISGDDEEQAKALASGISRIFNNTSPEELTELIVDAVKGVAVDGKKINNASDVDVMFQDDLLELYKLFFFVLRVNYQDFFKGQLAEKLLAKAKDVL